MNFWDTVYDLRQRGEIPRSWTKSSLLWHLRDTHNAKLIDFVVSGNSVSRDGRQPGRNIRFGFPPQAWRVGRYRFQLVADPDDDPATRKAERRLAAELAEMLADPFADPYPLRGHPYRWDNPLASTYALLKQDWPE